MTFKYEFKEEKRKLLPDGIYKIAVQKSKPRISPNGNKVFDLTLRAVKDEEYYFLFESLVFAQAGLCRKKISNFCKATKINDFENNEYREDFSGLEFLAVIGTEKDLNGNDRNFVKEWIIDDSNKEEIKEEDFKEDEIPF